MAKLFELSNLRNHVSRNGFDLSKKHAFSAKVGELLPIWWRFTYPGDSWSIRHKHFTRTVPVQTSAFTRIREYFDFFYVPFRLMSKNSSTILTQMTENPVYAKSLSENVPVTQYMPYIDLETLENKRWGGVIGNLAGKNNFFGYDRGHLAAKLLSYLGYGWISDANVEAWSNQGGDEYQPFYAANIPVSIFPLAAYQKICQDFFRNTQWETARPYLYNFDYMPEGGLIDFEHVDSDYWTDNTIFDLNYANWQKDLFMGILPDSQFGDVAKVETSIASGSGTITGQSINFRLPALFIRGYSESGGTQKLRFSEAITPSTGSQIALGLRAESGDSGTADLVNGTIETAPKDINANIPDSNFNVRQLQSNFDILALRQAEFLQRWKEIAQSGSQDYREQIYKHFGVRISGALSYLCQYLGGDSSDVTIDEVVNQALGSGSQADIKGKGVGSGNGKVTFKSDDYGVIMCIYHATPLLDYSLNAPALELDYVEATDFPIPEFDKIGMQELPNYYFCNDYKLYRAATPGTPFPMATWGYVPRYAQLKTDVDIINGVFKTTKPDWVAPMSADYLASYFDNNGAVTYKFFKVNPALLDSIFGLEVDDTVNSDQLLVNSYFDVRAVRNFDYDGMPY